MNGVARGLEAPAAGPVLEWEEVNCPLCDGHQWSILVEAPDPLPEGSGLWFAVVQCRACGLCFTNPRPTAQSIGQFYPAQYLLHRSKPRSRPRRGFSRHRRLGEAGRGAGRLLDFGCGAGDYLVQMHQRGWQVLGLDTSPAAVQHVHRTLGLPALVGTLPHPALAGEVFDVITMWQSLEHVHSPRDVLRAAHQLLAPGGKLLISVPNIDSLPFRWFGPAWFGLELPRHLTHFTPWALHLMLETAGFRVVRQRWVRHSDWLRASARLACRRPGATRWQRWLQSKPVASLAAWYSYLTKRADCLQVTAQK